MEVHGGSGLHATFSFGLGRKAVLHRQVPCGQVLGVAFLSDSADFQQQASEEGREKLEIDSDAGLQELPLHHYR